MSLDAKNRAKRKTLSVQEGDSELTVQTRAHQKRDKPAIIVLEEEVHSRQITEIRGR